MAGESPGDPPNGSHTPRLAGLKRDSEFWYIMYHRVYKWDSESWCIPRCQDLEVHGTGPNPPPPVPLKILGAAADVEEVRE